MLLKIEYGIKLKVIKKKYSPKKGEYKNYFLFGPGVLTLSLSNLFTLALASS